MLRGNERKNIFISDEDKQHFIEMLIEKKQENKKTDTIHKLFLMDNHFNLLIR